MLLNQQARVIIRANSGLNGVFHPTIQADREEGSADRQKGAADHSGRAAERQKSVADLQERASDREDRVLTGRKGN